MPMAKQGGWRQVRWSGAVALGIGLAAGWAQAQTPEAPAAAAATSPGRDAFVQFCASCHGDGAQGNGPMAGELRTAPPDLTRLGARFGTPLNTQRLLERIDGRNMARAHGSTDMPVWGRKLGARTPRTQGTEAHTRGTLLIIIDYLGTIQRPAE